MSLTCRYKISLFLKNRKSQQTKKPVLAITKCSVIHSIHSKRKCHHKSRIMEEYFQAKIGRKIRIFSLVYSMLSLVRPVPGQANFTLWYNFRKKKVTIQMKFSQYLLVCLPSFPDSSEGLENQVNMNVAEFCSVICAFFVAP